MKKLSVVFGISLAIFFAGFFLSPVFAKAGGGDEDVSLCDKAWNTEESGKYNPNLYEECMKAEKLQEEVLNWMRFKNETLNDIKEADGIMDDGTLFKEKNSNTEECNSNTTCMLPNPKNKKELSILNGARIIFARGYFILKKIRNKSDSISQLEKEKLFIEASEYFQKAEKLARKPVIHSGGILPGPKAEEDGESYFTGKFLTKYINGSLVILFSIGTLIIIIGGLMFLFASESDEMKTKAKNTIFWGITGLVIAVMAYVIVKFVIGLDFGF